MKVIKQLFPVGRWTLTWLIAIGLLSMLAAISGGR